MLLRLFGLTGHLATIVEPGSGGSPTQSVSAHWDGDTLLFANIDPANYANQPTQFDIGKLASGNASNGVSLGFSVEDRDASGSRIASHDAIGFMAMAMTSLKML